MDKRVTPYQTNGICMSHYYCLAGNNVLTNRVQRRITVFLHSAIYLFVGYEIQSYSELGKYKLEKLL